MKFHLHLQAHQKPLLLLNVIGASLALGALALLLQIDTLIHSNLYNFGLQFSYEWAVPYWTFERVALGLLASVGGVNVFSALYMTLHGESPSPMRSRSIQPKLEPARSKKEPREVRRKELSPEKSRLGPTDAKRLRDVDEDGVEIAALPLVCNKCGKVFTQPLCMFDFKSGKPRLVNVCPYCNAVLAVSGNSNRE